MASENPTADCPRCGGDCGSENPPPGFCPVRDETAKRSALLAEYDRACLRYRRVSQRIEDAEDERDEIRRECERLERELGL